MILDTAYLYNMTEAKKPRSIREAAVKNLESTDLEMELEALEQDYDDFGADGFYAVSFDKFKKEFPVFTKSCLLTFLKEMEILTKDELKDSDILNKYWKTGELIVSSDWPCLISGAKKLLENGKMQWEKVYKSFYKKYMNGDEQNVEDHADADTEVDSTDESLKEDAEQGKVYDLENDEDAKELCAEIGQYLDNPIEEEVEVTLPEHGKLISAANEIEPEYREDLDVTEDVEFDFVNQDDFVEILCDYIFDHNGGNNQVTFDEVKNLVTSTDDFMNIVRKHYEDDIYELAEHQAYEEYENNFGESLSSRPLNLTLKENVEYPLNDGEGEETCKEAEDYQKENDKALNDLVKEVEKEIKKINGPDKDLTELLFLPEPMHILNESEELDEAIPQDLAKAYKSDFNSVTPKGAWRPPVPNDRGYKQINGYALVDFLNSDYQQITPEEFKKLRKAKQLGNVQLIFDGQPIVFSDDGHQLTKIKFDYDNREKFLLSNGHYADWSSQIPVGELAERADAIYVVNEKNIDPDLRKTRAQNAESPNFGGSLIAKNLSGLYYDWTGMRYSPYSSDEGYRQAISRKKSDIDRYTELELTYRSSGDNIRADRYARYAQDAKDTVERLLKEYVTWKRLGQDKAAAQRYNFSNADLRKTFNAYKDLKKSLSALQYDLQTAQDRLTKTLSSGSPERRDAEANLQSRRDDLERIKKEISQLLQKLLEIGDDDLDEIAKLQKRVNDIRSAMSTNQAALDKLLKRGQKANAD